ncbi:MAG: MFS transporter, partial [Rhodocyclaceae bacterium]|nr:MFS transporter [Rhodocyclaceae bacterium]
LLLMNGVTLIAVNTLVGLSLAPSRSLASLPVTAYVVGTALTTVPAAHFMKRHGRPAGFMLGALIGMAGGLVSALAVDAASFWLLCFGTLLGGCYNAFGLQYRFAAADAAPADWKSRAISLTLAGGILGGILGPETGKLTRDLLAPPFLASYLTLTAYAFAALLVSSRLDIPPLTAHQQASGGRPLREIARQPAFAIAVLSAAGGYGVMNLLMTATPLAMQMCGHPFAEAAFVLEWHVIGMFAPSFFTGDLIRRFGAGRIIATGAALLLVSVALNLAGTTVGHFWAGLVTLGVGWNFLYLGGTTLLTETHRPEERAKVQGGNDFLVFAVQGVTSLGAGALITGDGWQALNLLALPIVLATGAASLLYLRHTRR